MGTANTFNLKRLFMLICNDLRSHSKTMLMVAATLIVFFALLPFHVTGSSTTYFVTLYIGGFIISSFAFNDLHNRQRAYLSLMLPCSNLERLLNKWLLTTIGYALGTLLIYYLFSWLSVAVNVLVYHQRIYPLDIFQLDLWIGIGKYIILQSIILLGAISFRRFALIKTLLVIGCLFLLFSLASVIIAWMFCPNCFHDSMIIYNTWRGGYFIFWVVAAPIYWYLTYMKLIRYELI